MDKQTEWVYCNSEDLERVFNKAEKKYGGIVHNYSITEASLKRSEPKNPLTSMSQKNK